MQTTRDNDYRECTAGTHGKEIQMTCTNTDTAIRKDKAALSQRARALYVRAGAYSAAVMTTTVPAAVSDGVRAIEGVVTSHARALRLAAAFCVLAGLALLAPETFAQAQGGGGGSSIDPDKGANEVFNVIGLIALLAGGVMAIGSLFMRRVMAALGFALAGGIIWACCKDPEGTMGAAAEWLINQFS